TYSRQLPARVIHQWHAAQSTRQAAPALRYAVISAITLQPGIEKVSPMARAIAAITQPMQLHAEGLQILDGRCRLFRTPQQAHGSHTKTPASGCKGMQMIGVWPAKADQAFCTGISRGFQVTSQLEPLVARELGVDQVQT